MASLGSNLCGCGLRIRDEETLLGHPALNPVTGVLTGRGDTDKQVAMRAWGRQWVRWPQPGSTGAPGAGRGRQDRPGASGGRRSCPPCVFSPRSVRLARSALDTDPGLHQLIANIDAHHQPGFTVPALCPLLASWGRAGMLPQALCYPRRLGSPCTVLGGVGDKALEAPGKGGSEDTAEMSRDLLVGGYGPGVPRGGSPLCWPGPPPGLSSLRVTSESLRVLFNCLAFLSSTSGARGPGVRVVRRQQCPGASREGTA